MLEFDPAGNLVGSWGEAGYEWPQSNHGIFVDHKGNVWIGGNGAGDSHILKFTHRQVHRAMREGGCTKGPVDAEGLSTPGTTATGRTSDASPRSSSTRATTRPTSRTAISNKRVAVLDTDNGTMKQWAAMGTGPTTNLRAIPSMPLPRSSSAIPSLRRRLELMDSSTCVIASTTGCRSLPGTESS